MDVKTAIETGNTAALRQLLARIPGSADELIRWGKNCTTATHPLHYVSDMLFEGMLQRGKELPLIEALLEAGADVNFRFNGKGDTPLIGAASLGAEEVGIALLEAGAMPDIRGLFGETALHWAALLGEDRLAERLIKLTDVNLKDEKYDSTPLGWAVEGWRSPPAGNQGRQPEVAALLVAARARVEPEWLDSVKVRADERMQAALEGK